jgi:hypothetical protein
MLYTASGGLNQLRTTTTGGQKKTKTNHTQPTAINHPPIDSNFFAANADSPASAVTFATD